ncbi:hypothetical protein H0H92_002912 [Tricholoma furcatifolium]|nr:hypothetical protein H0H92_002912 [Tricholoma furcatifolium]
MVEVFEERMAALEGGVAAIATASGQAAQSIAVSALASSGDNIIASASMYGGVSNTHKNPVDFVNELDHKTWNQLAGKAVLDITFKQFGIQVKFISAVDPAKYAAAIDANTKAIYIESIANPKFIFHSIKDLAAVAHDAGIPLIVDNTLGMGGYLLRPIDHGADIVVESATKWICGHGIALGGVVIDSGNFNWKLSEKFPALTKSDSRRQFAFVDTFGRKAFAAKVREDIQHNLGATMGMFSGISMLQGIETLSLRADKHCLNAFALARWLETQSSVAWVSYLGFNEHESHAVASTYLRHGLYGGVLTFGVKGGPVAADKVLCSLKLASHLANLGDTKTLVIRPSGTTHGTTLNDPQDNPGSDAMIRVSVGIEAIEDIIDDFRNALNSLDVWKEVV